MYYTVAYGLAAGLNGLSFSKLSSSGTRFKEIVVSSYYRRKQFPSSGFSPLRTVLGTGGVGRLERTIVAGALVLGRIVVAEDFPAHLLQRLLPRLTFAVCKQRITRKRRVLRRDRRNREMRFSTTLPGSSVAQSYARPVLHSSVRITKR